MFIKCLIFAVGWLPDCRLAYTVKEKTHVVLCVYTLTVKLLCRQLKKKCLLMVFKFRLWMPLEYRPSPTQTNSFIQIGKLQLITYCLLIMKITCQYTCTECSLLKLFHYLYLTEDSFFNFFIKHFQTFWRFD